VTTRRIKLSDQIRRAIDQSGMSRNAICKELQIDKGQMSRFMAGTAGLSVANIDAMADLLGLDITTRESRGRKAR
jgi:transcriptional regulator with XRE-family HTH domain